MRARQKGFSLIELLIVVGVILVIAAIAIPSLLHAKMSGNEAAAVGSMHTVITALQTYAGTYGAGYPATLAQLGPGAVASSSAADLIDSTLATGQKSGFVFTYVPGTASHGIVSTFTLTVDPATRG